MALVVRVHFLKAPARNVVVKEPREKKMRAIKDEVFSSLSRQFKGEPSDYEAFLHHPRRVLAGVVGDDPAEDTTTTAAATRDESSPRPPASSAVEMCWLRDDEYLPLPDGVRPKCDIELRRKHQVVKIKCYDKAKTVLIDFTVPLRDWLPLVRKKFDREDDTELTLYLSGEPQPLDVGQPLFDQEQLSLGIVLCLRRPDDPVDKPTPWFKHRAPLSLTRGGNTLRDTISSGIAVNPTARGATLPSPSAATSEDVAGALAAPNSAMRGTIYIYANNKHKWEKRWFVLDNDLLFYYKNASEGKATDVIDVQQYLLKEGEVKKKSYAWDLILSPNAKLENVDGKKLQNYSLKTESAMERKEWMAALQKIMDRSGSKNGPMPSPPPLLTATSSANLSVKKIKKDRAEMLFGRPLELAVHNPDGSQIPALIVKCINYIDNERILAVEGIFRLSGSAVLMDKYAARFDKGEDVDLTPEQDPHTVTGLLKYYFRELPEPLMTVPLYEHFISAAGTTDKALQLRFLRHLVNRLPPINKALLHYLFSFLVRVAANADKNKMAPSVIATVFAPALLRRADQDPIAAMADTPKINSIVVVLIQEFEYVFRGKDIDPRLTTKGMGAVCCRAQHDYEAKSADELSFAQGAVMRIVVEDPTWPYCESKSGSFGRVPSSYVQVMTVEQSQEYAERQQVKQRMKKAIEENDEQQKELKALSEENEELAREVEELLLRKKKVELDFYMLREVLLPVMEKSIVIRDEDQSRDRTGRRPQRKLPDGDADKKEEVYLADFPKYLDKFLMESENHRRALDAVGTAKDQFLTSLEMFLGAIPVARHKKEKYQKLRQSAQVIKDKTKAEAFCRMELSELKDDIIRDLTELQGALKFSIKRPWTEEEEEQYSPLAKTLMPPMLQQQQPLSARGSSRSSSSSSSSSSNRDGPLLSARGSRERP